MQTQIDFHSFYRIVSVEYTHDGCCLLGIQISGLRLPQKVNLSQRCCSMQWLKRFHAPDLDTLWQLIKQQRDITSLKRMSSYMLIKGLMLRDALIDWEEEAKSYAQGVRQDFDDW